MYTFNYKGATITDYENGKVSLYVAYEKIGEYRTVAAAKAAATRAFRAWRRAADSEHHASIQAIVARATANE